MDMKERTEECRLSVPYINQSTVTECGEEFTLPDYYPEVRRVVSTMCRVLPESWYNNGDTVEQGGVTAFTVLYLGDDGSLTAVPLTTDYTAVLQLPKSGEADGTVLSVDTAAENVTCRATGPRRLSLRARLRTTASGERMMCTEAEVTDSGGDKATPAERISVQTLEGTVPSMRRAVGKITGNVSGELRERAGTKPVMCDGEIVVNEASLSDGMAVLRGEAMLWCICFGDDGLYFKTSSRASFEEKVPLEGEMLSGGSVRGFGRCAAVSVKESDDGTLVWDMEYDLECEAAQNVQVSVARDMYSTMWMGNTAMGECESLSVLSCHTGRLSVNGSGRRNGATAAGDYIVGSFGKAVCDRVERTGARLTASGNAEVRVIICGGGEAVEEPMRIPFRYECDCPADGEGDIMWRCDMSVIDSTARLEGAELHVTAELAVSLFAYLRCPAAYVSRLELDRSSGTEDSGGVVRIYYPSEGESAWDITKKYRIPKNAVTEVTADGVLIE